jgi:alkylation response protein AidB-like acyl-CoA dehydrogenase
VFEALAYGDVPFTAYLTIHNMVCGLLARHAPPALAAAFVPRLATMELLGAYCLTGAVRWCVVCPTSLLIALTRL